MKRNFDPLIGMGIVVAGSVVLWAGIIWALVKVDQIIARML